MSENISALTSVMNKRYTAALNGQIENCNATIEKLSLGSKIYAAKRALLDYIKSLGHNPETKSQDLQKEIEEIALNENIKKARIGKQRYDVTKLHLLLVDILFEISETKSVFIKNARISIPFKTTSDHIKNILTDDRISAENEIFQIVDKDTMEIDYAKLNCVFSKIQLDFSHVSLATMQGEYNVATEDIGCPEYDLNKTMKENVENLLTKIFDEENTSQIFTTRSIRGEEILETTLNDGTPSLNITNRYQPSDTGFYGEHALTFSGPTALVCEFAEYIDSLKSE